MDVLNADAKDAANLRQRDRIRLDRALGERDGPATKVSTVSLGHVLVVRPNPSPCFQKPLVSPGLVITLSLVSRIAITSWLTRNFVRRSRRT